MMCLNVDFEVLVNRFVNCAVPTHPVLFSSVHIEQAFFFFQLVESACFPSGGTCGLINAAFANATTGH